MEAHGLIHTSMGYRPHTYPWMYRPLGGLDKLMGYDGLRSSVLHRSRWHRRDECMCQEMFYEWICRFQSLDQVMGCALASCNLEVELPEQGLQGEQRRVYRCLELASAAFSILNCIAFGWVGLVVV